ncbi:MerR-like DNA binding protein [Rhodovulum kholense]|uniref:MerR-like DNA binding protein n=1 Tax=Rhodovulum kholense TaxID=453584 RepID=A0A8E3AQS3_9RHOB|nr:MerR-like DNA binding protein [Rhodovulum kholense]
MRGLLQGLARGRCRAGRARRCPGFPLAKALGNRHGKAVTAARPILVPTRRAAPRQKPLARIPKLGQQYTEKREQNAGNRNKRFRVRGQKWSAGRNASTCWAESTRKSFPKDYRHIGHSSFPPDAKRTLRRFPSGEVAQLLGVKDAYLRKLHLDGKGPSPEIRANGHRYYSPENIQELRKFLEAGTKTPGTYLPGRREGDHLQVITVINFKGGSPR